jgi:hypothetical protein
MRAVSLFVLLLGCAEASIDGPSSGDDTQPQPDADPSKPSELCPNACDDNDTCTTDTCEATGCKHERTQSGMQMFAFTGSMQMFAVPMCVVSIRVTAAGAQGGNAQVTTGGMGATLAGDFTVAPNESIAILVGGQGAPFNPNPPTSIYAQRGGTGGGGTFVVKGTTILVIAGGGGGASGNNGIGNGNGGPGQVTAAAQPGGPPDNYAGGVNGGGGTTTSNPNGFHGGTGGGGYSGNGIGVTNGNTSNFGSPNAPGTAFLAGGAGGVGGSAGRNGGYGGAGAAGATGGGGGGYSGGGAGPLSPTAHAGGGGGSLNNGANPVDTAGSNPGHGYVTIEW